jgi:hypothetical protein
MAGTPKTGGARLTSVTAASLGDERPNYLGGSTAETIVSMAANQESKKAKSESVYGTNRTTSDVRSSVANGGKPDIAPTAQFGRE